jgi:hypothetical protein
MSKGRAKGAGSAETVRRRAIEEIPFIGGPDSAAPVVSQSGWRQSTSPSDGHVKHGGLTG